MEELCVRQPPHSTQPTRPSSTRPKYPSILALRMPDSGPFTSLRNHELAVPFLRIYERATHLIGSHSQGSLRALPQGISLAELPAEVLIDIMCRLFYTDIVATRRVCKRFKAAIDETSLLQYIIERGAAGYTADEVIPACVADALASFRRMQRIYRAPKPTCIAEVDLSETDPDLFRHVWRSWRHAAADGMLTGIAADGTAVGILTLRPTVAEEERFRLLTLGSHAAIEYVHIDVSQDLVIVVDDGGEITPCALSSGTAHPKCTSTRSMRMPPLQTRRGLMNRSIFVSGQWLLACNEVYGPGPRDRTSDRSKLYHWPTGREMTLRLAHGQGSCLLRLESGCMTRDGYALIPYRSGLKDFFIAVFSLGADPNESPTHRASYALPRPHCPTSNYSFLQSTGYPSAHLGFAATDSATTVLALGPPDRMIVQTPIFTHNLDKRADASHIVVPWNSWGPAHTRALHYLRCDIYASSGARVIVGNSIFDFNRYDLAHNVYAPESSSDDVGSTIVSTSEVTSFPCGERSYPAIPPTRKLGPLDTCMPFRVTPLRLPPVRSGCRALGITLLRDEHVPQLCRLIALDSSKTPSFVEYYTL